MKYVFARKEQDEGEKDNCKALCILSNRKKAIVKCYGFQAKKQQYLVQKAQHFEVVKIEDKARSSLTIVVFN